MKSVDDAAWSALKQTGKIFISFLPLFAFWFIALGHSLTRLQIGLYTGIALLVVMVLMKLTRGMILGAIIIFFGVALVFGVWMKNSWTIQHLGVLSGGILFVIAMLSMILGRPFVQDYAREGMTSEQQESIQFVRTCFMMTSFWASIFLIMALLNILKLYFPTHGELFYLIAQLGILMIGLVYTAVFTIHVKRRRVAQSPQ